VHFCLLLLLPCPYCTQLTPPPALLCSKHDGKSFRSLLPGEYTQVQLSGVLGWLHCAVVTRLAWHAGAWEQRALLPQHACRACSTSAARRTLPIVSFTPSLPHAASLNILTIQPTDCMAVGVAPQ